MSNEVRETPGERLVRRLTKRERRRPRLGFAPEFYARLGTEDPWTAAEAEPSDEGRVFLSSAPYYAMMRRLAAAARRRERRLERFSERRAGRTLRAATRPALGEAPLATSRLARLAVDALTLPPPVERSAQDVSGAVSEAATPRRRRAVVERRRARVGAASGPAATTEAGAATVVIERIVHVPVHAGDAPVPRARPLDRVGARASQAAAHQSAALRAAEPVIAALPVHRQSAARRAMALVAALPEAEQPLAVARVLQSTQIIGRGDAAVMSRAAPHAARRIDPAAPAGLRPVLGRSPAMALAASADTDRAAAGTLAEAERRAPDTGAQRPRRVTATSRASQRADAPQAGRSSVPSPVSGTRVSAGRPLAASPVVRAVSASPASSGSAPSPASVAVRPSAVALARGLDVSAAVVDRRLAFVDAPPEAVGRAALRAAAPAPGSRAARSLVPSPIVGAAYVTPVQPERDMAEPVAPVGVAARGVTPARGVRTEAPTDMTRASLPVPRGAAVGPNAPVARTPRPITRVAAPAARWAQLRADAAEQALGGAASAGLPDSRAPLSTRATPTLLVRALLAPERPLAAAVMASGPDAAPIGRLAAIGGADGSGARDVPAARSVRPSRVIAAAAQPLARPIASATPGAAPLDPVSQALGDRAPDATGRRGSVASAAAGTGTPRRPVSEAAARRRAAEPVAPTARAALRTRAKPASTAAARVLETFVAPLAADVAAVPARVSFARTGPLHFVGTRSAPGVLAADAPVRTREGAYVTARVAAERGLAVTADAQGRLEVVAATTAGGRDASARPSLRGTGAVRAARGPVGPLVSVLASAPTGADAVPVDGDRPRRVRASERAVDRARVERATAYRGAFTAPAVTRSPASPSAVDAAAPDVPRAPPSGRGATSRRSRASLPGAERVLPSRVTASDAAAVGGPPGEAGPGAAAVARRSRAPLEQRLGSVSEGRTDGATGWMDRAEGSPRIRSVSGMLGALARASTAEEVVRVIAARAEPGLAAPAAAALPLDPVAAQVIAQVRDEARREVAETVTLSAPETRDSRLPAPEASMLRPPAGSAWQGPQLGASRPRRVAAAVSRGRASSGGEDKLSKLVRRLQDLIHLAEDQNRLAAARSEVRMAEDSAQARAEGQAGPGSAVENTAVQKQDIEALGREVLDAVAKELELRRARRMEDADDSVWW
jgi:hypothetical protein